MRVIAGKHRGLTIPLPKGGEIRPTTDRAKESLFSILNHRIDLESIKALDLFSGSGNISFELASRGCEDILSIEKNRRVSKQAQQFAEDKGIQGIKFRAQDVLSYIKQSSDQFDLIFADPPYHKHGIADLPKLIEEANLLFPNGILIIEHETGLNWSHPKLEDVRKYGQSAFAIFQF